MAPETPNIQIEVGPSGPRLHTNMDARQALTMLVVVCEELRVRVAIEAMNNERQRVEVVPASALPMYPSARGE